MDQWFSVDWIHCSQPPIIEVLFHQCSVMVNEKRSNVEGQEIIDPFLKIDKSNISRLMQVPA